MCNPPSTTATETKRHGFFPHPMRFLMFPLLAVSGTVALVAYSSSLSPLAGGLGIFAVGYAWYCVGGCFHELVHHTLTPDRNVNTVLGQIVGTMVLVPFGAYRETHMSHHARLNAADDYEMWPYCDPRFSRGFRIVFAWFDLLVAGIAVPLVYGRVYFSRFSTLSPELRRSIRNEYLILVLYWSCVIALGFALDRYDVVDWRYTLLYVAGPMWVGSILNTLRKFVEHLGLASTDPLLGTRTILGGNLLTRMAAYVNFELCIHGPHHRYPKVRHEGLADTWEKCVQSRPEVERLKFRSFLAAFWDMLPALLLNPASGVNVTAKSGTMSGNDSVPPPAQRAA